MYMMEFNEETFEENFLNITGDGGNLVFLDAFEFRRYVNTFYRTGVTYPLDEDSYSTHWVFKPKGGDIMDSYADGSQPSFDIHCTMFSLYNELWFNRDNARRRLRLGLGGLRMRVTSHLHYLDNLIEIYSGIAKFFSRPVVKRHMYKFSDWSGWKKTWLDPIIKALKDNASMLEVLRQREVERGAPRAPFELWN